MQGAVGKWVVKERTKCCFQQDHLRMNNRTGSNIHLRPIDLFRSMIIQKNRQKVRDNHPPPLVSQLASQKELEYSQSGVGM